MKKLIIICLLALTHTSTYAQEPTKQETMDWIGSKFRDNMNSSTGINSIKKIRFLSNTRYTFNSYSSGIVSWTEVSEITIDGTERTVTNIKKIDLNGLTNIEVGPKSLELYFKEGYSKFANNSEVFENVSSQVLFNEFLIDDTYVNESVIDWSSEPDLFNRFVKALNVLVSYNTPKQKF